MIGSKETVLFDIGSEIVGGLLRFDIWFNGVHLTLVDNMAYPPSMLESLKFELDQLKNKRINPDNFWFNFGPTTDDFSATLHLKGKLACISLEFESNTYNLNISIIELQKIYESAINAVSAKNT